MATDNGADSVAESRIAKADHAEGLGSLDLTSELGVTGLHMSGGQVVDTKLKQLRGHRRALAIFAEMARYDDVVGGMLYAVEMIIRQLPWRTDPGGDTPQDREAADFIESLRLDMSSSWEDSIAEILSMIWAGFSYHEIVYKRREGFKGLEPGQSSRFNDGKIGWRKLPIRGQQSLERWSMDEEGGLNGMFQRNPNPVSGSRPAVIFIPIEKALLFRPHVDRGSPEGRSMLERAFISWYYKKQLTTIEAIGIERDATGMPVAWVPSKILANNASGDDKATLLTIKEMVVNIRRDEQEGFVMPLEYDDGGHKLFDLTLLTSGGRRQIDVGKAIMRHNRGIAAAVMAQFILMGDGEGGSLAMHKDKTELFLVGLGALVGEIKSVFNRHAIPRVLALNGMSVENPPHYEHGDIHQVDLAELGDFLGKLTAAGAPLFPDDELENHLRGIANLPEKAEETVL